MRPSESRPHTKTVKRKMWYNAIHTKHPAANYKPRNCMYRDCGPFSGHQKRPTEQRYFPLRSFIRLVRSAVLCSRRRTFFFFSCVRGPATDARIFPSRVHYFSVFCVFACVLLSCPFDESNTPTLPCPLHRKPNVCPGTLMKQFFFSLPAATASPGRTAGPKRG